MRVAAESAADEDESAGSQVVGHEPQDRGDLRDGRSAHVHRCMERDHREVAEAEGEPGTVVRAWDGEGDDQEAAHAADQSEAEAEPVGGDRVRQPCVAVVHPPDQEQHDHHADDRFRVAPSTSTAVSCVIDRTKTRSKKLERRDPDAALAVRRHYASASGEKLR